MGILDIWEGLSSSSEQNLKFQNLPGKEIPKFYFRKDF